MPAQGGQVGGQSPQHLVNEFAAAIANGTTEVVLVFGAEAMSTVRHLAGRADRPDFTVTEPGDYPFECTFHTALGQVGTMVVTGPAASPTATG